MTLRSTTIAALICGALFANAQPATPRDMHRAAVIEAQPQEGTIFPWRPAQHPHRRST
jgi:hypothetical protein